MSLLNDLLSEQTGPALGALAQQFGISQSQAKEALGGLVPSLARGIGQNTAQPCGLENLMKALQSGNHTEFLDNPAKLTSAEATQEGNAILGHILGSKEASRAVAKDVSGNTGLSEDVLKKMLPVVAAMAMGALSKKTKGGEAASGLDLGSIGAMLGIDGDNAAEGLIGLASKFLKR